MIPSYSFCTPLPVGDPEYSKITELVLKSYPRACITMIDKYENPKLREAYEGWREELRAQHYDQEYTVYHGTRQQCVEGICKRGFLPEAGRVMAQGFGIYFAAHFGTSWNYTNTGAEDKDPMSYIFICKILPGRIDVALADRKPSPGYHSRADNPAGPKVFAIPEGRMMIPEYLVRFHKISEVTYEKPVTVLPGFLMTEKGLAREAKRLAASVRKLERKSKKSQVS